MIETREQFIMQGADYSAQEPRILTQLCEDINMLRAYTVGKDLYVEIAAISFNLPYKLCLEHFPKGCPIKKVNDKWVFAKLKTGEDDDILDFTQFGRYLEEDFDPELYDYEKLADGETDVFEAGYELRNAAKRILLGIMYGRGASSIAEQLYGKTDDKEQAKQNMEKAQAIKDKVYVAFPGIKIFEDESKRKALLYGYVTNLWGRKRRLPNYRLPRLEFFYIGSKGEILKNMEVPSVLKNQYTQQYNNLKWDNKREFIETLKAAEQILIIDNSSKIADAERQIINSQVQGCLDGDVRVQSQEFGIVKIQDFVGKTLTLWDGHEWTPGTIVASGKKQKCIIHFIGGQQFICSPDHKFDTLITNNQHAWCKCAELKHAVYVQTNQKSVDNEPVYNQNLCVDYVEITDEYIDMYDVCNTNNGYFIADGLVTHNSAADMSKMAMISILNDPELIKRLVKIIIPIHDEIIIEVPLRFARYTKNRFAEDMKNAAKPKLTVPVSCDVVNSTHWTGAEIDLDELLGDLPEI